MKGLLVRYHQYQLIPGGIDGMLSQPGDPTALASAIAGVETKPEKYEIYGNQARAIVTIRKSCGYR